MKNYKVTSELGTKVLSGDSYEDITLQIENVLKLFFKDVSIVLYGNIIFIEYINTNFMVTTGRMIIEEMK